MHAIALKNKQNEIVRFFHCPSDRVYLILKSNTGRVDLVSNKDVLNQKQDTKNKIKLIKEFQVNNLNTPYSIDSNYSLELVKSNVEEFKIKDSFIPKIENKKELYYPMIGIGSLVVVLFVSAFFFYNPKTIETLAEEQKVVKIIKPPPIIKLEKTVVHSAPNLSSQSTVKPTTKPKPKKSLKRMGALAALGSLSKNETNNRGGLNLGAKVTSAGPGLRSLAVNSGGSGGVQSSIYSKGMIVESIGSGGNIKGGGGYGTKGTAAGGGQAGYGKLGMIGSGGTADLSEASSMTIESGSFDSSLIDREILKHIGKVRNCYDKALRTEPDLKGIYGSQIVIASSGRVATAKMHPQSEVKSQGISDCILAVLKNIQFKGVVVGQGLLSINYQFDLTALN